ncbi:hypothetical protein PT974_02416 [Cladobotryum mycophilum]|uniref:DUF7703 domain-containing protein n=1 Tax=Cladobotryum mycophilum TaxID=491253 RepID=A0ABR0SZ68_9HYPO
MAQFHSAAAAVEARDSNLTVSGGGITPDSIVTGSGAVMVATFLALAMYNFLELNAIILTTFKKRAGLYFWSFMVATWGLPVYSLGFLIKNFHLSSNLHVQAAFIIVGWSSMVTGQSMVLYSRLHLVLYDETWLRAVLIMIIVDAIICHTPIAVFIVGANSSNPGPWVAPYSAYEKVQVTIFFLQEMIISGLYIAQTLKILRITAITRRKTNRHILRHLLVVSVVVAILDTIILSLEYANLYYLQTTFKALVYSMKLKLEFSILNRLVDLAQPQTGLAYVPTTGHTNGPEDEDEFNFNLRETGPELNFGSLDLRGM